MPAPRLRMIAFILLPVSWVVCENAALDVQDLLSVDLSPAALLGLRPRGPPANQTVTAGDLSHALDTMLYHRSMMNEYLCHNYVADEILSELRPLESRSGETPVAAGGGVWLHGGGVPRDQLLADPGSSGYKDWLDKSSGMGDIDHKDADQQGFETGDVTGYATVGGGVEGVGWGGGDWSGGGGGGGGWSGGGGGWSGDGGSQGWHDNSGPGAFSWEHEEHESGKGLALKELFDLALTALAFLAFKVFALQLIMACFAKTPHMTVVMPVTTAAPAAETRVRRGTNELNELAYRVLSSIEVMMKQRDDSCLQYTLCDNNRYSRALDNRLWLPVWSLGMSWAARLWNHNSSRIDNIRASVLGLGDVDCAAVYPRCSLARLRTRR